MAQDDSTDAIAVAERPEPAAPAKKRKKSQAEEEFGYDVDFETPFGKIEFALEPTAVKERKDQERREKAERDAAKAAAKAAKKAEKRLARGEPEIIARGGSNLVPILLIFLLVAGAIGLAIWLFARPGDDEQDTVPPEFRNDDVPAEPEPAGFAAKAQHRIGAAIRAGRQASREAQAEQERKFQDLAGKS